MHPILWQVTDTFFISPYGVLIAIGLFLCTWVGGKLGDRVGISRDAIVDLAFIAALSGFVGARLFYILLNFGEFLQQPAAYIFSRTGFVFYGGLLAATAACSWYVIRNKISYFDLADIAGPCVAIGHAFGRIGCHFAGCCYGGACTLPIGIQVPRVMLRDGTPWANAWLDQVRAELIAPDSLYSLPIWPVQLIESALLFLLVGGLLWYYGRAKGRGAVFGAYLLAYAGIRFGVEFLRGDLERGVWFGLASTSQLIAIGMAVAGAWFLLTAGSRPRSFVPPQPPSSPAADDGEDAVAARLRRKKATGRT